MIPIDENSSFQRTIKEEHFKNLVAVAFSDGVLDESEAELLEKKATEFGIPGKVAEEIIENASTLEFVVPFNQVDREEQISDIVYMALVDGILKPQEYQLCLSLAHRLFFDQNYLDKLIETERDKWEKEQQK